MLNRITLYDIWMAGRARGPCFQMKNVNIRQVAQKTEGQAAQKAVRRAAEKGWAGCRKKGQPFGPPFSAAQLTVQSTSPP